MRFLCAINWKDWLQLAGIVFTAIIGLVNSRAIERLKSSNKVKEDLAQKRYDAYQQIIEYINSWYDVVYDYKHDILNCPGVTLLDTQMIIHRIKSMDDLLAEFEKVQKLCLNSFYYDSDTYFGLKCLSAYLNDVICTQQQLKYKGAEFKKMAYVVYCDLYKLCGRLSKSVNRYFSAKDTLSFKTKSKVDTAKVMKVVNKMDFTNIYINYVFGNELNKTIATSCEEAINDLITDLEKNKALYEEEKEQKIKRLHKKRIKVLTSYIKKFEKIAEQGLDDHKRNKMFMLWNLCKDCKNSNCYLNKVESKETL